jgi:hypothetical protein
MFSATEPLASSPLATNGTNKFVSAPGAVSQAAQTVAGTASRRKYQTGVGNVLQAVQIVSGTSQATSFITALGNVFNAVQTIVGTGSRRKYQTGVGAVLQAAQIVSGSALYSRVLNGSGNLFQPAQIVAGTSIVSYLQQGAGTVSQAAQLLQGFGTVINTKTGAASLISPAQRINGAGTKVRLLFGAGAVIAAPQTVYGSELFPIVIRTPSAPLNLYEVSLKITSQPYSTTNKYLTIYQVPSYIELQSNGTFSERTVTGIITAFSATTADGTPQPISLIIVSAETIATVPVMPAFVVTTGVENIIPLRDFNLVTNDVLQVKCLGSGDVTVSLSMLLNTQPYYEVL